MLFFGSLPPAVHLAILLRLPFVDRFRCFLVSKRWAALAAEPAFWADLSFEGADIDRLDDDMIMQMCVMSSGRLRSLDITAKFASRSYLFHLGLERVKALSEYGLTANLRTITTAPSDWLTAGPHRDRRARPPDRLPNMLSEASIFVRCPWPDFPHIARAIAPLTAGRSVVELQLVRFSPAPQHSTLGFVPFAAAVAEGLTLLPTDTLEVHNSVPVSLLAREEDLFSCDSMYERSRAAAGAGPVATADDAVAAVDRAAEALGAALAHPSHGPRVIVAGRPESYGTGGNGGCDTIPAFPQLCRALTQQSRLREVRTFGGRSAGSAFMGPEAVRQLTAALAPGRANIEALAGAGWGLSRGRRRARRARCCCSLRFSRTTVLLSCENPSSGALRGADARPCSPLPFLSAVPAGRSHSSKQSPQTQRSRGLPSSDVAAAGTTAPQSPRPSAPRCGAARASPTSSVTK